MYSKLFCKEISPIDCEQEFLETIKSAGDKIWWTAKNNPDGSLTFVKNKPNAGFFMARLTKFPSIADRIKTLYPTANLENSYATKCLPGYHMIPHIDANRTTALIIPLGLNKGKISFYLGKKKIYTHTYNNPTLTRVNILHSAENDSVENRYSITIELTGSYWKNLYQIK